MTDQSCTVLYAPCYSRVGGPGGDMTGGGADAVPCGARWPSAALLLAAMAVSAGATLVVRDALRPGHSAPSATPVQLAAVGIDADDLATSLGGAVHRVEADGCGARTSGTAFAVDANHLVTSRHVVQDDATPLIVDRRGHARAGRVVGWRDDPDLAVVAVEESLPIALAWADPATLREGQPLVALGYPLPAFDFAVTPAAILSFEVSHGRRTAIRATGDIDRGNSGGPALTAGGEVAGIVSRMAFDEGYHLVPLLDTAERTAEEVSAIVASPLTPEPTCGHRDRDGVAASWVRPAGGGAVATGSRAGRATLTVLRGLCEEGGGAACDRLARLGSPGTADARVAATCGGRSPEPTGPHHARMRSARCARAGPAR
jgi:hypothetical protein